MDDCLFCPICSSRLKSYGPFTRYVYLIKKMADYIDRGCISAEDHYIHLLIDSATHKIDIMKISINKSDTHNKFIEIDYVNNKSRIIILEPHGPPQYIDLPKMISPDFPILEELKRKVNILIAFS